ncbi:hypothetical protein DE146DRAFT_248946 [Phaeosphaeria sp. MPI-PUGE-AT-0046c]|nr:hypothetical protein DE146DRAFT_248946 [Phaeosphaeria sp. MPI-PUGE-AT-0046c]
MLETLISTYAQGPCTLKKLTLCLTSHAVKHSDGLGICHDIERVLLSFRGLESIFLDMSHLGLVSKESVINHSQSLETSGIGTSHAMSVAYKTSDLAVILNDCTKLTQLAIPLGIGTSKWTGLCHDELDLQVAHADQQQVNNIQASLVSAVAFRLCSSRTELVHFADYYVLQAAIATHSRLHSFRTMDCPYLDWNCDSNEYQWTDGRLPDMYVEVAAVALQNLATQVFRYLCEHGSRFRALAWKPLRRNHELDTDSIPDSNGHCWPAYAYYKGRVTDAQGVARVVAIPVSNYEGEMLESDIFDGRF